MKNRNLIFFSIKKLYQNMSQKAPYLKYIAFIYMVSTGIFDFMLVFFPKILLDFYIENNGKNGMFLCIMFFLIIGSITGWVSGELKERAKAKIGFLRIDYLADAFSKIITSDYQYMEDTTFFNRYDSAFNACSSPEKGIEKIYSILFELPALCFKFCIFTFILVLFSPWIIVSIILHISIQFFLKKKHSIYKYDFKEILSKSSRKKRYFHNITQDFQYGKEIRLYKLKHLLLEKYTKEILNYKKIFKNIKKRELFFSIIGVITLFINDVFVYSILITKAKNGISISNITMYFLVITIVIQEMNLLVSYLSTLYGEGMFVVDFFRFLNADLSKKDGKEISFSNKDTVGIEIKDFSFQYPNTDRYIYKNLNLKINAGEKIALLGVNGIGKSTLIKVLTGLFREFEGDIFIEGQSIKEMSNTSLFSLFSVVFQDINLLSYTVAENIVGNEEIDEEKVWDVLKQVGLENRIKMEKNGIHQFVHKYFYEDGLSFSGGESQKMAIARAIYKNSKVFILDEPTSAMDAFAEKEFYEQFCDLTRDKTTIFISHRLASTKFCDRIILIGADGILEEGTHEELMMRKGSYFEMFQLQGKYYQEEQYETD